MSLTVKAFLRKSPAGATPEYEIRRFVVDADVLSSFVYLVQKITTVFSSLENKTIELLWRDSENDLIAFSSDDELTEALSYVNDGVFKVYIEEKGETRRETKETGSSPGVYHPRIICDGCEGRVRGLRYKCTVCPNFDLCSGCKSTGLHSEHEMITIEKPVCRPYSGGFPAFGHPPYGCFPCPPPGIAPQHGMVPPHGMGPPHRMFASHMNVPQAYPTNCDEIRMQRRAWRRWMKANCGADSCKAWKKEKKGEKEDEEKRECNFGGRGWSGWDRCRGGFRQMGFPFGGFSSAYTQAAPAGGSFQGPPPPPEPQPYTQSHETDTDALINRDEVRMQQRAWRRWMKWNCGVDSCKEWKEKKEEKTDEEKQEKRERKAQRKAMREAERAEQVEAASGEAPPKANKDSSSSSSSSNEGDTSPTGIDVEVDAEHKERRKHCHRGGPWGCHFRGNFGDRGWGGWDGWGRGRGQFCQMGFPFGGFSSAPVRGPFQRPPPPQLYPQSHEMDINSETNREEMRMQRRAWRRWMKWNCGVDPRKAWKKEKKEKNEDEEKQDKRERKAERKATREAERAKQAEVAPGEAPPDKDSNSSSTSSDEGDTCPAGIDVEVNVDHRGKRKHCQRGGPWGCHMRGNFGGRGWGRCSGGPCQMGFPFGGFSSVGLPACGPFQGSPTPQLYSQSHEMDTDSETNRKEMRMQRRAWRRWMKWNCGVDPCKAWKKEKKEEKTDEEEHEKRERKAERKAKREAERAKQAEAAPGEAPPKADKDSNSSSSSSDEEDTNPTGIDVEVNVDHRGKRKHCQRGGPWGCHMRGNFGGRGWGRCSGGPCQMGFPFGGFSSVGLPACGPFQGSPTPQLYSQSHEMDTDSETNRKEMRMQRRAWRRWMKWNCGVDPCKAWKKEKKEEKTDEEEHEKRERKAERKAKREAERAKQAEATPGEAPPKADKDSSSSSSSSDEEDTNPTGIDVEVDFEHKGRRKHCQRGGPLGCHMRGNFGGRGWGRCRGGFWPMEFPFGGRFSSVHAQAAPVVSPFQGPPPPSELQPYPQSHEMDTNSEINREEIRMQRRAWRRWMKWNCGVDPCKAWKKEKNEEKTDEEKQEKRQRKAECKAKKEAERAKQAEAAPGEAPPKAEMVASSDIGELGNGLQPPIVGTETVPPVAGEKAKAAGFPEPNGRTLVVGHDEAGVAEPASGAEMSVSEVQDDSSQPPSDIGRTLDAINSKNAA